MRYRLEYHEGQRLFHLDNGSHDPDTFGWVTLHDSLIEELANQFIDMAESIMDDQGHYCIDFVKCLFNRYVELISRDMEDAIQKCVIQN